MTGLILKDLLNLKRQAKVYLILIIFYSIMGFANKNSTMISTMISMVAALIPITAIAYDERCKWDGYALTMPISRGLLILSKYILGLIFIFAAFILTFILNLIFYNNDLIEIVITNSFTLATGIIIMSVIFPILFKFGVEKGRIIMMMVLFAPTGIIMLLSRWNLPMPDEQTLKSFIYLLPVIAVILLVISIYISIIIYNKKEF